MIIPKLSDITKLKNIDAIVNAANGIGVCGRGVAGAIRKAADTDGNWIKLVREIAMQNGGYSEGECYVTPPGKLSDNKIKAVIHAVTMKYPGSHCSYGIVDQCLYTLFNTGIEQAFSSIAIPGLGTGIGNLDSGIVATRTVEIAQRYESRFKQIVIVDIDPTFIEHAQKTLGQ